MLSYYASDSCSIRLCGPVCGPHCFLGICNHPVQFPHVARYIVTLACRVLHKAREHLMLLLQAHHHRLPVSNISGCNLLGALGMLLVGWTKRQAGARVRHVRGTLGVGWTERQTRTKGPWGTVGCAESLAYERLTGRFRFHQISTLSACRRTRGPRTLLVTLFRIVAVRCWKVAAHAREPVVWWCSEEGAERVGGTVLFYELGWTERWASCWCRHATC